MPRDIHTAAVSAFSPTAPLFRPGTIPAPRQRVWISVALIATDVLVVEFCLYLGFLSRTLLAQWFPIDLAPPILIRRLGGVAAVAAATLRLP